jgi:hypothetical protein
LPETIKGSDSTVRLCDVTVTRESLLSG